MPKTSKLREIETELARAEWEGRQEGAPAQRDRASLGMMKQVLEIRQTAQQSKCSKLLERHT